MSQNAAHLPQAVTAVVVAHDGVRLLPALVQGVREQTHPVQRVVGVDTGSQDRSGATLTELLGQDAVFGMEPETGYGAAVARALQHPTARRTPTGSPGSRDALVPGTEWIWLLHDDCEPAANALEQLLDAAGRSQLVAVLGPKLRDLSDRRVVREAGITTDRAGRRLTGVEPGEIDQGQHDGSRAVLAVSSAGMLIRRDVWDQLRGFDANLPLFRDDIDFCWRAHAAGYEVRVITDAVVYHRELSARQVRKMPAADGDPRLLDRRSALYVFAVNLPLLPMLGVVGGCLAGSLMRAACYLLTKQQPKAAAHLGAVAWLLRHPLLLRRERRRRAGDRKHGYAVLRGQLPRARTLGRLAESAAGLLSRGSGYDSGGLHHAVTDDPGEDLPLPATDSVIRRVLTQPRRPALRGGGRRRAGRGAVADRLCALLSRPRLWAERGLWAGAARAQIEAVHLAGHWKGPGASRGALIHLASDVNTKPAVREAAFFALKKIGGQETVDALRKMAEQGEPDKIRRPAVLALAAIDGSRSGGIAISYLAGLTNADAALAVWRSLLADAGMRPVLAAALPRNGYPAVAGKAGVRAAREAGGDDPELIMALTRAAGLGGKEIVLTEAEVKRLGERAMREGNAARGERIFRRPEQSCLNCHSIGGAGGKVGPDLTPVGASSPIDYLIESVIYPNKQIKDGFQAYSIETTDDEELSGIPVRENDRELVIRTAADQDTVIPKNKIRGKRAIGSLMPSGLADNLTANEQLDLYRFLAELGKPGPFDASKGNVARLWHVSLDPVQTADEQKLLDSAMAGEPWHRATSLVSGRVLSIDLENAAQPGQHCTNATLLAGTRFRSVKAGPVRFDLSAPAGALAWIDGKPVHVGRPLSANLPDGVHTIIVKLDGKIRTESIRLQSDDGTFLGN